MTLKGQNILITGGTSGVGCALVRQLYEDNRIAVIGRDQHKLQTLQAEYPEIVTLRADLSQQNDIDQVAQQVHDAFPGLTLLINNAASQHNHRFTDPEFEYQSIAEEVTLNLLAPCALAFLLLPLLRRNRPSAILNINSGLALAPKTGAAVYCATKAGLDIFSQSLGYQLEGADIKVQQAFLPLVDTAMTKGRGHGKISAAQAAKAIAKGIAKGHRNIHVGKVKLLRLLLRLTPGLARKIMRGA